MRTTYRVLADLIAIDVVVQAAAIAFAMFGVVHWVEDGHTVDKAGLDANNLPGGVGITLHSVNGAMILPLIAVALFVVSFFAKVRGAVAIAGAVLVSVVLQVVLGFAAADVPALGWLHGALALVVLGGAIAAATLARKASPEPATT